MVLARMPIPTFVIKIENVTGIAIFMPTRKIPLVRLIMKSAIVACHVTASKGTARKLSTSAATII